MDQNEIIGIVTKLVVPKIEGLVKEVFNSFADDYLRELNAVYQGCSRDRLVRDQDRDRKIFPRPRPRPRPVSISILASRPRPAKFETKTETEKMTSSIVFSIF